MLDIGGFVFSFTHDSLRKTTNHEQSESIVADPGSSAWVHVVMYEPFVVCEFVSMVVRRHDVHQEDVLGFWVESCDLHLVAGEHPPAGRRRRIFIKSQKLDNKTKNSLSGPQRPSVPWVPGAYCACVYTLHNCFFQN